MERFNRIARQVRNVDQRATVSALTTALRPGPFIDYLYAEEPQSMGELQNKLASFIRIEEERAYQMGQEGDPTDRVWKESGSRRGFRREEAVKDID